jgi:polyhydroxyalkanoate synthase subunit PhaC
MITFIQSLTIINEVLPEQKIHAAGYCLGGTLLSIAAAWLASTGDKCLKSMTLFATQVDFKETGELSLFIDQSQITYLEDIMWEKGYLDGSQMSWAFSMLRSNDLIWSKMINDYFLGKRRPMNDLMAWDFDATRLPYKMHSEYLHRLFLNNDLVHGHYKVRKKHISLADIELPIFAVGTIKDHVAPWKSVYKIQLFTHTDVTFVLTNGGHNAGIVNEPGHPHRSYQVKTLLKSEKYMNPDIWQETAPNIKGSWWPEWEKWLTNLSRKKIPLPPMGIVKNNQPTLCDAPGTYVMQK